MDAYRKVMSLISPCTELGGSGAPHNPHPALWPECSPTLTTAHSTALTLNKCTRHRHCIQMMYAFSKRTKLPASNSSQAAAGSGNSCFMANARAACRIGWPCSASACKDVPGASWGRGVRPAACHAAIGSRCGSKPVGAVRRGPEGGVGAVPEHWAGRRSRVAHAPHQHRARCGLPCVGRGRPAGVAAPKTRRRTTCAGRCG